MPRKTATQSAKTRKDAKKSGKAKNAKPAAAKPKPMPAIRDKMSKAAILSHLAAETELSRKQVKSVLEELEVLINRHIKNRAAGEFSLPGLLKIRSVRVPARKKRMGRNPSTGEPIVIAAKPVSRKVKVSPLKRLRDMV